MNRAERRRGGKLERAQGLDIEGIRNNNQQALQSALNLIDANVRQQRLTKARKLCDSALAANPHNSQLNYAMGVVHQAKGDANRAVQAYQQAVSINPDNLAAWINLGICARTMNSLDTAQKAFAKALAIDPNSFHAHYNLGLVHCDLKQMDEALTSLRTALQINPSSPEALFQLGYLEEMGGSYENAVDTYQNYLKLRPNADLALTHAGACLQIIGRFDEAADHLTHAIELNPANGRAQFLLASSDQAVRDSGFVAVLEKQTGRRDLSPSTLVDLHFAAGRMHEKLNDYDAAFRHYKAGNDLARMSNDFNRADLVSLAARMKAVFTPDYIERLRDLGDPDQRMVFVVGMPRSGTTLVEQIIASHPQAYGAGELANFEKLSGSISAELSPDAPDALENLDGNRIATMIARYLEDLPDASAGALRVVDKTPGNAIWLGVFHAMFPNATFIHCSREPMDNLWSCYSQNFRGVIYSNDFDDLATYFAVHDELMDHWRSHLPATIHEVAYEELVGDQDTHIRRIIAATGLEWDERCLQFHTVDRAVQTNSLWQVRRPMYGSSIGKWKRFEAELEPLKVALDASTVS